MDVLPLIHFVTQIQPHAMWMQIVQPCTHDVIIISSVNNERVQLHTNARVRCASECLDEWKVDWCALFDCPVYIQPRIICFIQTQTWGKNTALHSEPWLRL